MNKTDFRIRNSMKNDWENMCGLAFKARWFGTPEEKELMDIGHKQNIRWGSLFEQFTLGSGVGGKVIEPTQKELTSEYYKRIKIQAEVARAYLFKQMGVPFIQAQVEMHADIEFEGYIIKTTGNADSLHGHNKIPSLIVDTKLPGDASNMYGDYAWGKPETMDMGQMVMYREQVKLIWKLEDYPETRYYVADITPSMRVEVIQPVFSDYYRWEYFSRLKTADIEIRQALTFGYFPNKASYNECKQCPLLKTCSKAIKVPEIKIIHK